VYDLLPVTDGRVPEARRRRVRRVDGEVEELVDDRREVEGSEGRDLGRGAAEAGPPKEMRNVCGWGRQGFLLLQAFCTKWSAGKWSATAIDGSAKRT
jgi:hypothetical protein